MNAARADTPLPPMPEKYNLSSLFIIMAEARKLKVKKEKLKVPVKSFFMISVIDHLNF
jgi:hypothetical protein